MKHTPHKHTHFLALLMLSTLFMAVTPVSGEEQELSLPVREPHNDIVQQLDFLNEPESEQESLAVCDHNFDGVRDLLDLAIFTQHKELFDVNNDGVHNLLDLALYAQNSHDDEWCNQHKTQFGWVEEPQNITITLLGDNPQHIDLGQAYVELGAEVTGGNQDQLVITTNNVNTTRVGTYHVVYEYESDTSHQPISPVLRTVIVQDTTAPVVSMSASPNNPRAQNQMSITVQVVDQSSVSIDTHIEFEGSVVREFSQSNTNSIIEFQYTPTNKGEYKIVVLATDEHGNSVTEALYVDVRERSTSSGGSRSSGNTGEVIIVSYEYGNDEVQLSVVDEEPIVETQEQIEMVTLPTQTTDTTVVEEDETVQTDNALTGAVVGGSSLVSTLWIVVALLLLVAVVLSVLYATVRSKNK